MIPRLMLIRQECLMNPFTKRLSPQVWNNLKSLGLLRNIRKSRGGQLAGYKLENASTSIDSLCSSSHYANSLQRCLPKSRGIRTRNILNLINIHCGDESTSSISNTRDTCLKFCLINTQSVKNKSSVFPDYLCDQRIDIAAVTETWFTQSDTAARAECVPDGYELFDCPRIDRKGGGTAIVFRDYFSVEQKKSGITDSFEFSECLLKTQLSTPLLLVVICRPPYSASHPVQTTKFLDEFSNFLEPLMLHSFPLLISGDFNIHVDNLNHPDSKLFMELLDSMNLLQHVKQPTHVLGHTLDLIITRKSDTIIGSSPIPDCFLSDHCSVLCDLLMSKPIPSSKTISFRKLKDVNIEAFNTDLSSSDLILHTPDDLNQLVDCYNSNLLALLNKHAPLQTRTTVIRPKVPWFDDTIRIAKRIRRKAEKKWRKSKSEDDKKLFTKSKNKATFLMNKARREFYTDFVNDNSHDQRKLFAATGKLLKLDTGPSLPPHNNKAVLADEFGNFFCMKIDNIRKKLDNTASLPSYSVSTSPLDHGPSKLSKFNILSNEDILELVNGSSSKSCQLDPIPTYFVKDCMDYLLPVLSKIINGSLQSGVFPDAFKEAIVMPILKKPNSEPVFKNFRPVSNLSFISKLTEKAVFRQIHEHLTFNHLYPPMQSAYRSHHSTETTLLKVKNDILLNMNSQRVTLLILLDLSAAFDTVDYSILVDRLSSSFGISATPLAWFTTYLRGRTQRISVNGVFSNPFNLKHGVPQGSCLGPLLFTLYSSKLFQIIRKHLPSVHCYADDTQLYFSFQPDDPTDQDLAIKAMEACINDIRHWMNVDKLLLNDDKTELILIGTKQQLAKVRIDHLHVGSVLVEPSTLVRNLGSWFDNHLNMKQHIVKTCSAAFYHLHNLRRIRKYLTKSTTATLVHAFITSRLDYCNSLLYGLPASTLSKLQRVQNAAARLISGIPRFCHITPTLRELHWLPIPYRIKFKMLILTFKAIHGQAPLYLQDLVVRKANGKYCLRSSSQLLLGKPTIKTLTTLGDRSFYAAAPFLWNKLPNDIRSITILETFKNRLKTYFFKLAFY